MALESTDLLVVQKQSGAKEVRKASLSQLSDYLQAEPGVTYRGTANFTDGSEEPGTKQTGDLYINDAPGSGTWAWSTNTDGIVTVEPGDRALYNGATWDVIQSGVGDAGVTVVTASLPISVTGTAEEPNIESRQASTTDSGHVARLATAADVDGTIGTGSSSAVVTADLLKQVNVDIGNLDTGVTTVDASAPLSVSGTTAEPVVESREANTTDSGHVQRLATAADVAKDGTGDSSAVVTADLLKQTNIGLDAATAGGLTTVIGVDPIEVTTDNSEGEGSSTTSPAIAIKNSAIGQRGAISILDDGTVFGNPADSADYATWVATLDATQAMTANVTAKNFVYADFSALEDA